MKMVHRWYWLVLASLAIISMAEAGPVLRGEVRDRDGSPVVGASVHILVDSGIVSGGASDLNGQFVLTVQLPERCHAEIRVNALGFFPASIVVSESGADSLIRLVLDRRPIVLPLIRVEESPDDKPQETLLEKSVILRGAQHSHVGTNPVAALREPQLARRGSNHSSTLRINGSTPQYFVNGIGIGSDPNHYGMFSIVPVTMVERISFYPQGTPARFATPSVIDLATPERFKPDMGGEGYLSLVEGTGSLWRGTEKQFLLGSVRYSILDMIANQVNIEGERSTIPPTTFRDFFLTGGMKHGADHESFFDAFIVGDRLLFESEATSLSTAFESNVQTSRYYLGARTEKSQGVDRWKMGASLSRARESYTVNEQETEDRDVHGNLVEHTVSANQFVSFDRTGTILSLSVGADADWTIDRKTRMEQRNWNFLPPDANSNTAFPYSGELNHLYGAFSRDARAHTLASYASATTRLGKWESESGARFQYFSELREKTAVVVRQRLAYHLNQRARAELFAGTFAENPVTRILEPYQVITRADVGSLAPVTTHLLSGRIVYGPVSSSVFIKEISDVPSLVPDFSHVDNNGMVTQGFLSMKSVGRLNFHGADISLSWPNVLNRFDLYAYYGYTEATRVTHDIAVPYELNAPHRFLGEITCRPTQTLTLSASLQLRTGYPYTPERSNTLSMTRGERYSETFYQSELTRENSLRFSPYATINVHGTLDLGRTELSGNLTNVTNRANPLVSTGEKYIYDLGIFPSVSVRMEF